jgi:hypothetical protein
VAELALLEMAYSPRKITMARVRPEADIDPQLVEELAESCAGLSALESALLIAEGMRYVYGGEWQIEANTDGSFAIMARN